MNSNVSEMASCEVLLKNQERPSQRRPRPLTFAEFGADLKPYFTTYQDPERPSSFLELGLDVEKESSTFDTRVGKYRKWKGLSIFEKIFLVSSLVFLLSFLALTTDRLVVVDKSSQDFTFVLLLLLNAVFCVYYVAHGIFREHGFELFVYAFSVGVVLIYCFENHFETELDSLKLARFVLVVVFVPPEIAFAVYLGWHYHQTKNLIFRTVGANLYRQNLCVKMYMFADLLKFDLQLECSVVILGLKGGVKSNLTEGLLVGLGVPISLMWNLIGYLAVRYEKRTLLLIFIATGWLQPTYVTYKFIDIYHSWKSFTVPSDKLLPSCIIVCGFIGLFVHSTLIILVVHLGVNFDNGLGQKVFGSSKHQHQSSPPKSRDLVTRRRPFSWAHPGKRDSNRTPRSMRKQRKVTTAASCSDLQTETLLIDQFPRSKFKARSNLTINP